MNTAIRAIKNTLSYTTFAPVNYVVNSMNKNSNVSFLKTSLEKLAPLNDDLLSLRLAELRNSKQGKMPNCYMVSAIKTLPLWDRGREVFQKIYKESDNGSAFIRFLGGDGKFIKVKKTALKSDLDNGSNRKVLNAFELATRELFKKETIPKLKIEPLGYGFPSNYFKLLTGEKPIVINNPLGLTFNNGPKKNKKEVINLLNKAADRGEGKYALVALTSFAKKFRNFHCISVTGIDKANKTVNMQDTRASRAEEVKLTYDEFLKTFKGITGYID